MKRKIVIIVFLASFLIGCSVLVLLLTDNDTSTESQQLAETTVELQGTSQATRLESDDDATMQEAIQNMVKFNEPDADQTFVATVRKGSAVRTTTSYGAPKLHYLVDIPQLQRTFAVEREGDSNSDSVTLYVICPQQSELRYPAKTCKQIE